MLIGMLVMFAKRIFSNRRDFLKELGIVASGAALAGIGLPGASPAFAQAPVQSGKLTKVKVVWGQTVVCHSPISVALKQGFFEKYGLDIEPVNFSGSTDALLQAIAAGHADAGIGMALRWMKPLEQGFDVKLAVGTHGGCMRLLVKKDSGYRTVADLVGQKIAVSDQASPIRNFFAIQLAKLGIDPDTKVSWVQYPADLFGEALAKGEVQAIAGDDPQAWLIKERYDLAEIGNNLEGEYANVACCVLGLRGTLLKENPETAKAITKAFIDAQAWTAHHPAEASRIFAPFVPSGVKPEQLEAMLREHTHGHHSTGSKLRDEVKLFVEELKTINVIRPDTNADKFAEHFVPDILKLG